MNMEIIIGAVLILMIIGSLYILHAKDLMYAIISYGIVGFGLVVCFFLLQAPDLAIVQIVIETITLIIMIAVIINTTRKEIQTVKRKSNFIWLLLSGVLSIFFMYFFYLAISYLDPFGVHSLRMSEFYLEQGLEKTGSMNLITGILLDFRGYDTLGEATILFTAAIGVLTVLRIKSKKSAKA